MFFFYVAEYETSIASCSGLGVDRQHLPAVEQQHPHETTLLMNHKSLNNNEWPGEKRFFSNSTISLNDLVINVMQVETQCGLDLSPTLLKQERPYSGSFMSIYFVFFKAKSRNRTNDARFLFVSLLSFSKSARSPGNGLPYLLARQAWVLFILPSAIELPFSQQVFVL